MNERRQWDSKTKAKIVLEGLKGRSVIVGYHIGYQSKSSHWLSALDTALQANFPYGVRGHNLNLMSDNGCQPTSKSFMETCKQLEINHVVTSYNNPKDNADTERMMQP